MRIFEALLVKACGPLSFILLVLWSQDDEQGDQMTINIIFAFVITYSMWWFVIGHKRRNIRYYYLIHTNGIHGIHSTLLFFSNFFIIYRVMENENSKRIITDHAIPYMDLVSVYNCITHELWCLINFLYSYARYLRLTPCKGIGILIYLFFHAVCLLMILDFVYSSTIASVQIFLTENFFSTYSTNITKDYSMSYADELQLERDNNYPAFVKEIYVQNTQGNFTLQNTTKEIYKDSSGSYLPYHNISVLRYIGEDVEISCSFFYTNSSAFRTVWLKDGKQLAKSNRYMLNLNISRDISEESKMRYSVTLIFRIHLLSKYDFGKYECVLTTFEMFKTKLMQRKTRIKEMYVISVYNIGELPQATKIIYHTVGSLMLSAGYFYYHMLQNDDLSIEYKINDRPVMELCGAYITQACSIGSKLRRLLDSRSINSISDEGLPNMFLYPLTVWNLHSVLIEFCMCSNGYGIHRVSFQRETFLKSRNTSKILDFQHPVVIVMLPQTRVSLFRYFDDEHLYKDIEKNVENGTSIDIIEHKVRELLEFIAANEEKVFTIANIVQSLMTVISLITFNMFIIMFINFYFKWFIRIPIRSYVNQPILEYNQQLHLTYHEFDVVISHSDNEYSFVSLVLVPFLENECHLRVCLPERDFHQGKSIYSLYTDAFIKSRKIMVVLSTEYVKKAECYTLQLEHLILPMLYEERKGNHDVLFIKYDDRCRLPEPLRWNFDVDVLPWTVENQTVLKLNKIKLWYFTGNI